MTEPTEQITVGAVSDETESPVDLPVVELLTGRGFVTGKSGSGKSNTASVVAEKLLDRGLSLLIVDIDGEYYGLKEEYEILHVGNDEECDIRVSPEHAEKITDLALDQHVPIILDVSSFLDERDAKELLTEIARQLFAKAKKRKQPFLLVVEEIHEWLPEGAGLDECGRMLIKVAKRGRKHGLGMCGISQRPADVKKDFITQCDWLVWHRLTWGNDTKVVKRILGSDYADWVEGLGDGEGFLMTDWNEEVSRVQFDRKQTFDAGATPGLDGFERPELKSVSGDLVSDLEAISDRNEVRQNRIAELERELADKQGAIDELEAELAEARDLSNMAEQFSRAMMAHADGKPFRTDITGVEPEADPAESTTDGPSTTAGDDTTDAGSGTTPADAPPDLGEVLASSEPTPADETQPAKPDEASTTPTAETGDASTGPATAADESERGPLLSALRDRGATTIQDGDIVSSLQSRIAEMDLVTREMLARYMRRGVGTAVDVHAAAGGGDDRSGAYRRNRTLRTLGLITHVGRGQYNYTLPGAVETAYEGTLTTTELADAIERIEASIDPESDLDDRQTPGSLPASE